MKKSIIIFIIITNCLSSVYSQTKSNIVVNLTKTGFLTNVFDYEKNTQWSYVGSLPCIIDFYADWCRPCREVAPTLEAIAKKYDGKVIVYKVNTDKERELARLLNIESIPTFLFIPMRGEPVVVRGVISQENFEKGINQILLK